MTAWIGSVNTIAPKFLAGASDLTIRDRLLLSLMERRGKINTGTAGRDTTWLLQVAEQPTESYGDGGFLNYARHDLYKPMTNTWRGYKSTDMMTELERLEEGDDLAIIKRYSRIVPTLVSSVRNRIGAEFYFNGNNDSSRFEGITTFMGQGTCTSVDKVAANNGTYGGQSTVQGTFFSSQWSNTLAVPPNASLGTDWPYGSGDAGYDAISAKLVNSSATGPNGGGWGTNSTKWEDNCIRVIRETIRFCTRTGGKEGTPTLINMGSDWFVAYQNKQESKDRGSVPHPEAQELGFPNVLQQEGVMIQSDFDVPAATAYAINVNQFTLEILGPTFISSRGPERDPFHDAWLFSVGLWGNFRWQPKFMAEIKARA